MPKFYSSVLAVVLCVVVCAEKSDASDIRYYRSMDFSGLELLDKAVILKGAVSAENGAIAADMDQLRMNLSGSALVDSFRLDSNGQRLSVIVKEKKIRAALAVVNGSRVIPALLTFDNRLVSGSEAASMPVIVVNVERFVNGKPARSLLRAAGLVRWISDKEPDFYSQILSVELTDSDRLVVKLNGRRTLFRTDFSRQGLMMVKKAAAFFDTKEYYPDKMNIIGDRAVIR